MVVGNVAQVPHSIFDAAYPLTALIANNYGEMMSIPLYDAALLGGALILLLIVLAFNTASRLVLVRSVCGVEMIWRMEPNEAVRLESESWKKSSCQDADDRLGRRRAGQPGPHPGDRGLARAAGPEPGDADPDAQGRLLPGQGGRHPQRHRRLALPGRGGDGPGAGRQPAHRPLPAVLRGPLPPRRAGPSGPGRAVGRAQHRLRSLWLHHHALAGDAGFAAGGHHRPGLAGAAHHGPGHGRGHRHGPRRAEGGLLCPGRHPAGDGDSR